MSIKVCVKYFAQLKDEADCSEEDIELIDGADSALLYAKVSEKHRFSLEKNDLRVAINGQFGQFTTPLKERDVVAFIPPVSGG